MQTSASDSVKKQGNPAHAEPTKYRKRIGSTTFMVVVHSGPASEEVIHNKILRLIKQEVGNVVA
jgi:hypothetical protein